MLRIEGEFRFLVRNTMRRLAGIIGFALILGLGPGCERQVFLQEKDLRSATNSLSLHLEHDPSVGASAISMPIDTPPTVDFPDRPPRFLSLQEAIAIALEEGTASSNSIGPSGVATGTIDDTLLTNNRGLPNNQTDKIRVLKYNPAIAYTTIESSLARFDPKFSSYILGNVQDDFQLRNTLNGETVTAGAFLSKALSSGGVLIAGIGNANPQNNGFFQANYSSAANSSLFAVNNQGPNQFYTMPVTLALDQPLLRDFGFINYLLNQPAPVTGFLSGESALGFFNNSRLPLSQGPNFTGLATPGILLARLQFDQARAEFERQVNNLLVNAEVAYWNLYKAYGQLYANEEVLRLAQRVWGIAQPRFATGQLNPPYILETIRAQYEEFRGERLKALGLVLEAERNLRRLIGLPIEDGTRIIPITPPSMAPYQPNWYAAREDALALRPELILARQNLKNAQYNLMIQKNFLKPELRFIAQYQPIGFGTTMTGNGVLFDDTGPGGTPGVARSANVWRSLSSDHFDNWMAGLVFNVPLGYRQELAGMRQARLGLVQSYEVLADVETRTISVLCVNYQKIYEWWDRIEISRREHESYADSVLGTWRRVKVGMSDPKTPDLVATFQLLLDSQRRLAAAMQKEYEAISEYNSSLARFEWSKGTILQHDSVNIAEGPLPECVQERAVDNERQRSLALVLRERPTARPITQPALLAGDKDVVQGVEKAPEGPMPRILDKPGKDDQPNIGPPPPLPDRSKRGPEKLPAPPNLEPAPQTQEVIPEMPGPVTEKVESGPNLDPAPVENSPPGSPTLPWLVDPNSPPVADPPPVTNPPVGTSSSSLEIGPWGPSSSPMPGLTPN
jgi:outer membrane protein TolC